LKHQDHTQGLAKTITTTARRYREENTMETQSAKSASGRTEWRVSNGRLTETSPESFQFTLTATDTFTLLRLLYKCRHEIAAAMQKEKGVALTAADAVVDQQDDNMLSDVGPKIGQTSSIEIAPELKQKDPGFISPSRGS
jgi:hypothetical protein